MDIDEMEFMNGTVAELLRAIEGSPLETRPDGQEYSTSVSPDWWPGERTFGGMVVAQALYAAMKTVPAELPVHSLHGYFLRPSQPGIPTTHLIERVRDGRTFTTRDVRSEVRGKTAFRMTCSFHAPEAGDDYQLPMADDVPPPRDVEGFEAPFPFDIRELGATQRREDGTFRSTRRCWFRTRERMPDDPALHACVLAYLSDMTGAAFRPLSLGTWGTHTDASLDHALWFHRPARADQWNLFDLHALVNAGGRATIRATMHGEDGQLHLSMAQELLIRKLEVPIVFEAPPWVDRARRQLVEGDAPVTKGESDGTA
ncbi:MAG TPA: acyl-CoA thioesterase domain-containing protein [Acidimicrobiales bacterium]|nr:acyl-CoA thioesterase domain-containing protein [Acidimicrobiales bacterium]